MLLIFVLNGTLTLINIKLYILYSNIFNINL